MMTLGLYNVNKTRSACSKLIYVTIEFKANNRFVRHTLELPDFSSSNEPKSNQRIQQGARQQWFHNKVEAIWINFSVFSQKRSIGTEDLTVHHIHSCLNVGDRVRKHIFHIHANMGILELAWIPVHTVYLQFRCTKWVNNRFIFYICSRYYISVHTLLIWLVIGTIELAAKKCTNNQKQRDTDWNPKELICDTYIHTQ